MKQKQEVYNLGSVWGFRNKAGLLRNKRGLFPNKRPLLENKRGLLSDRGGFAAFAVFAAFDFIE